MKSYEIQPTMKNLTSTYKSDTIERNKHLHYFVDLLETIDGCAALAVDGKWGCGKTFFVKQVKMIIDAFNEQTNFLTDEEKASVLGTWRTFHSNERDRVLKPQICVYYDAWQHDNDDDPLLSLVYEIYTNVNNDYSFKKSKDGIEKLATIVDLLSGKNYGEIINTLRESDDPLSKIKENRSLTENINEFISSLLAEQGERLIVFVDELDRCKPTYAVRMLERIKHYFANENVTFVFSVNSIELQHTIKQYYGANFDACRYLNRFFDLMIPLPKANLQKFYSTIGFSSSYYTYNSVANTVIETYGFELREIAKYTQMIKIAASAPTTSHTRNYDFSFPDGQGRSFCLLAIVPIVVGLQLYDGKKYSDFISGKEYTPLVEILLQQQYSNWLCSTLLTDKEELEDSGTGKTVVKLEDKLQELYDALFNYIYDVSNNYRKNIGKISIDQNTKKVIFEAISLLSGYADYSE